MALVPLDLQQKCLEAEDRDEGYAILEGVEGVHTNVRLCGCLVVDSTLTSRVDPDRSYERGETVQFGGSSRQLN